MNLITNCFFTKKGTRIPANCYKIWMVFTGQPAIDKPYLK